MRMFFLIGDIFFEADFKKINEPVSTLEELSRLWGDYINNSIRINVPLKSGGFLVLGREMINKSCIVFTEEEDPTLSIFKVK